MNVLAATGERAAERFDAERRAWGFDPAQDVGVAGDAATVADAVRRWAEAGADTVVLQPTADEPDPEGFVRFVAAEVQPLVRSRAAPVHVDRSKRSPSQRAAASVLMSRQCAALSRGRR